MVRPSCFDKNEFCDQNFELLYKMTVNVNTLRIFVWKFVINFEKREHLSIFMNPRRTIFFLAKRGHRPMVTLNYMNAKFT